MADLNQLIREYLQEAKIMQIATKINEQPWVCSVWYASDDQMNIYWMSATNRRHSKELEKNPKVGATISLQIPSNESPRGVQLQGIAQKLTKNDDIQKARSVFQDRVFDGRTIDSYLNNKKTTYAFYRLKPTLYVLYDAKHFPENPRQEFTV